jgi:hypothetical protein
MLLSTSQLLYIVSCLPVPPLYALIRRLIQEPICSFVVVLPIGPTVDLDLGLLLLGLFFCVPCWISIWRAASSVSCFLFVELLLPLCWACCWELPVVVTFWELKLPKHSRECFGKYSGITNEYEGIVVAAVFVKLGTYCLEPCTSRVNLIVVVIIPSF